MAKRVREEVDAKKAEEEEEEEAARRWWAWRWREEEAKKRGKKTKCVTKERSPPQEYNCCRKPELFWKGVESRKK